MPRSPGRGNWPPEHSAEATTRPTEGVEYVVVSTRLSREPHRLRRRFSLHPAQAVVLGFAVADLIGTALLSLPISSRSGQWTHFVDALFTATSAVCVTGLTVLDTRPTGAASG